MKFPYWLYKMEWKLYVLRYEVQMFLGELCEFMYAIICDPI
jgi:hypothetical protein